MKKLIALIFTCAVALSFGIEAAQRGSSAHTSPEIHLDGIAILSMTSLLKILIRKQ